MLFFVVVFTNSEIVSVWSEKLSKKNERNHDLGIAVPFNGGQISKPPHSYKMLLSSSGMINTSR